MTDSAPDTHGLQDHADPPALAALVPMADIDDPLVVEIFHAFEVHDDAVEDQDGDYTRGLARLAAATAREWFVGALRTLAPEWQSSDLMDAAAWIEGTL